MPSEVAKKLWDRRQRAVNEARELLERAAEENRDLGSDEQNTYESLNAEIDSLDKRVQNIIAGEQRAQETEQSMARINGDRLPEKRGGREPEGVSTELRAFLKGEQGAPRAMLIEPQGVVDFRDLGVNMTTATGGTLVPRDFYGRLVEHMIEVSGLLQANPTVLRTESGNPIDIPTTTAHGTATLMGGGTNFGEGSAIPESDPTFALRTLNAYKFGEMIQVSRELIDDNGVDLLGYLAKAAGRALGNAIGSYLVTGTGTNQPTGVLTSASAGATGPLGVTGKFGTQTVSGQGADLLITLFHSVISPYRNSPSAGWLMNDLTAAEVRKIKDSTGNYIWQSALTLGDPDRVLGKPVNIDPYMPNMGTSAESIAFGDWGAYFVRLAGGIRFERSDEFAFSTDLVTFRALARADGILVDQTGAIKTFAGGTA